MTTKEILRNQIYVDAVNLYEDLNFNYIDKTIIKFLLNSMNARAVKIDDIDLIELTQEAIDTSNGEEVETRLRNIIYHFEVAEMDAEDKKKAEEKQIDEAHERLDDEWDAERQERDETQERERNLESGN